MKIALFWPPGFDTKIVIPLSLGYLKSNAKDRGDDIRIFDCALDRIGGDSPRLHRIIREFDPQIVGVSCWSSTYEEALRILKTVKSLNSKIVTVVGGIHATAHFDMIIKEKAIDFLFRGEAELSFPDFLNALRKGGRDFSNIKGLTYLSPDGSIISNEMEREGNLDKIKIPDYDAIRLDDYLKQGYKHFTYKRHAPIWITRGCPYECEFCMAPLQNGRAIRYHSIEYVARWIKFLYDKKNIRHVNIIDDNFTCNKRYATSFCKMIIDLNLKGLRVGTPSGLRMQHLDKELLELMKRAGWEYIFVAPESGSLKTLKKMKKNLDPALVPSFVQRIKDIGFKVIGFFIIGYPGEDRRDIEETLRLIRKCKFHFFYLFNFQPLPGTSIYDELVKNGEIPPVLLSKTTFSSGDIVYTPRDLKGVNFSFIRLMEYINLAVRNPSSVIFLLKNTDHRKMFRILLSNIFKGMKLEGSLRQIF